VATKLEGGGKAVEQNWGRAVPPGPGLKPPLDLVANLPRLPSSLLAVYDFPYLGRFVIEEHKEREFCRMGTIVCLGGFVYLP